MPDLTSRLRKLEAQGLLRSRRTVTGPQGPYVEVDGQRLLAFCSNDYLGLAGHPAIAEAAKRGLDAYGTGAAASALICGHTGAHAALEARLAALVGAQRALCFSTGYMANLGILPALLERGDAVFSDALNHACLIDAARLSRADVHVYPHGDVAALARMLADCTSPTKLVARHPHNEPECERPFPFWAPLQTLLELEQGQEWERPLRHRGRELRAFATASGAISTRQR
jgi:8-amino-7-oxononanoate synthase